MPEAQHSYRCSHSNNCSVTCTDAFSLSLQQLLSHSNKCSLIPTIALSLQQSPSHFYRCSITPTIPVSLQQLFSHSSKCSLTTIMCSLASNCSLIPTGVPRPHSSRCSLFPLPFHLTVHKLRSTPCQQRQCLFAEVKHSNRCP